MTFAKKTFYLSSSLLLAGAMSMAQTAMEGSSQDQDSSRAGQSAGAVLQGCLSGSTDNYTLTDHNGSIYHLVGSGTQLQAAVGHEVAVTGMPDSRRTGVSDSTTAHTASSFQVTGVRDVGSQCHQGSSESTAPMSEQPPKTDSQPKGAPGEGAPPEPHPQLIAMLQQPGAPEAASPTTPNSTGSSSMSQSSTSNPADAGNTPTAAPTGTANQSPGTPPPVSSQTPATPQSPTDPNAQLGTGTASQTGTSAAGTNATTGTQNSPEATGTAAAPQADQNDPNKPLYERQATDIPWAQGGSNSKAASTSTTTSASPKGSSSTSTTTTTPEPHL